MIVIVAALVFAWALFVMLYFNERKNMKIVRLAAVQLIHERDQDYEALEQGREEEQEAYEQMYLSHIEKILLLEANLEIVKEDRQLAFVLAVWHEMHCLPDLELMNAHGLVNKEDWENLKFRMGVLTG